MKTLPLILLTLLCSILHIPGAMAQKTFQLDPKPALKISGTSTLHDWEMTSGSAKGKLVATEAQGTLATITSLNVEMPAESLKSGKKAMDKKAYDALKTDKYNAVKFELTQATKTVAGWNLKGNFTIAGITKEVTITVKETSAGGQHTLSGQYGFKLTDYKITPPTALMGTIKTGDAVKISFTVSFK